MSQFWKNAGILSLAEVLLKAKALVMMPFITKHLGAVNYGVWAQVVVIVSLLSPLVFMGTENSLNRFLPGKARIIQSKIFSGWLFYGFLSSFLVLGLLYISADFVSLMFFGEAEIYKNFILLSGFTILATSILTGFRYWYRIQNNAINLVVLTIIQNILQFAALLYVLIYNKGIYELVLYSIFFDGVLIAIYLASFIRQGIIVSPSFHWVRRYFKFGIAFLPSGYAIWILNSVDRVFLVHYDDLKSIGIYSIGFTLGYTIIQLFINPIWSLFSTRASELFNKKKTNELSILLNQSLQLIFWIVAPSIMGFLIVGEDVMRILSTEEFASGYLVVPIILFGYTALMLSSYFEMILILRKKPFMSTVFTVIACIANIILNIILIPSYSYFGAAIATALSFLIQLGLSIYYALMADIVQVKIMPIVKIVLSSLIMFVILILTKRITCPLTSPGFSICVTVLIGIGSYFLLSIKIGIFNLHEIRRLVWEKEHV